jgi:hypothetical protein
MLRFAISIALVFLASKIVAQTAPPAPPPSNDTPGLSRSPDGILTHIGSSIKVPTVAAGLAQGPAHYYEASGNNISIPFGTPDDGTWFTLYLYRAAYPSPQLWMETAEDQIFKRYISTRLATDKMTLGDALQPNGIMTTFQQTSPEGAALLGGVGIANINGWLAKVRVSSTNLDAVALNKRIAAFNKDIAWPKSIAALSPYVTPATCAKINSYGKFKWQKPTMSDALGLGIGLTARHSAPANASDMVDTLDVSPQKYCRLPDVVVGETKLRVYQGNDASSNGWSIKYTILIGDSGRAVEVSTSAIVDEMAAAASKKKNPKSTYVVSYHDASGSTAITLSPSLPKPEEALQLGLRAMSNDLNFIVRTAFSGNQQVNIVIGPNLDQK